MCVCVFSFIIISDFSWSLNRSNLKKIWKYSFLKFKYIFFFSFNIKIYSFARLVWNKKHKNIAWTLGICISFA